jgi:hypothetical protein
MFRSFVSIIRCLNNKMAHALLVVSFTATSLPATCIVERQYGGVEVNNELERIWMETAVV